MPGASLPVLRLDAARLALLDASAEAPAWWGSSRIGSARQVIAAAPPPLAAAARPPGPLTPARQRALATVAAALDAAEHHASYLGARAMGTADAGATAVAVWRRALAR